MSSNQEISVESFHAASAAVYQEKKRAVYDKYSALFLAAAKKAQEEGAFQCCLDMESTSDASFFAAELRLRGFDTSIGNATKISVMWHKI